MANMSVSYDSNIINFLMIVSKKPFIIIVPSDKQENYP